LEGAGDWLQLLRGICFFTFRASDTKHLHLFATSWKNSIAKAEISWENLGNGDGIFRITWGTIFFPKQLALEVLTELKRGPWCGMT